MKTFSALLAIYVGNSPGPREFPAQRPVTRSFDVSFDLRWNKRLTKQSWGWRFETPSRSLWRHCNALWVMNWKSVSITCINSQWRHMATNICVTLAQLMACCLGAPNHYMNHFSLMRLFRIELGIHGELLRVICTRINGWVNNGEAGSFRRHRVHYDVTVMYVTVWVSTHECGTSDNSIYYILSCYSYDITQTSWETRSKYPGL